METLPNEIILTILSFIDCPISTGRFVFCCKKLSEFKTELRRLLEAQMNTRLRSIELKALGCTQVFRDTLANSSEMYGLGLFHFLMYGYLDQVACFYMKEFKPLHRRWITTMCYPICKLPISHDFKMPKGNVQAVRKKTHFKVVRENLLETIRDQYREYKKTSDRLVRSASTLIPFHTLHIVQTHQES